MDCQSLPAHLFSSLSKGREKSGRALIYGAETLLKDEGRIKTEKEKAQVALRNCGYPEWALKEGEQLGKRQKWSEEEIVGQGGKDRHEEPKTVFVVLRYIRVSWRGFKEPI